jgi:hypothetical protein
VTDVDRLRERARSELAAGRVEDALAAFVAAEAAADALPPSDPRRIALAGEHAEVHFTHREDPSSALEVAMPAYEAAADAIDDAGEHPDGVRELLALRDRMTFWAFHT